MANSGDGDLPATLARSPERAAKIYEKTLVSAEATYHDEKAAHRVAWGAVKNDFEKVGHHWEAKEHGGPSDERAKQPHDAKIAEHGATHGGIDVEGHTREELRAKVREQGIAGTSRMTKDELAHELDKKQRAATAKARTSP